MKDYKEIYKEAYAKGMEALENVKPTPMAVGTAVDLFGDSDEMDTSKPMYIVPDGPCGFAWINIKPANCGFAKWIREKKYGNKDSYYGGVTIWVHEGNQSIQRKAAFASAFATVLNENGIKATADSRLD